MDLKTVQTELHRLAELVGHRQQPQGLTPIERDLLLARLRDLYETVLFDAAPAVETPAEQPAEPLQGAQLLQEPALSAEPAASVPAVAAAVAAETVAEPAPAAEAPAAPEPTPAAEPAPATEPAEEPAAPAEEEPVELDADAFLSLDGLLRPSAPSAKPAEAKTSPFGNLFDDDADFVQHRRKQQVIMSLYDPAPVPTSAPAPAAEPQPAEVPADLVVGLDVEALMAEDAAPETPAAGPAETPETPEAILEQTPAAEAEAIIEVIEVVESDNQEESVVETVSEPAPEPTPAPVPEMPVDPAPEAPAVEMPEPAPAAAAEPAPQVLGEVIAPHVQTLGESLAPPRDRAAELRHREPVTDLRRAVGINDKFLLIRDLFNGNGSLYEITIRRLNEFDNLDDCLIYIAEHFAWNPNSDGAKLLMDLLERKFS